MYELVGFTNLLDIDCGFIFPIFRKESRLFFQDSSELIIKDFFEANKERIQKCYYEISPSNTYYDEGAGAVFAFLLSKEPVNFIFGSAVEIRNKLDNYLQFVSNDLIKEDITDFIAQVDEYRKNRALSIYKENNILISSDIFDEILNGLIYNISLSQTSHCLYFTSQSKRLFRSSRLNPRKYRTSSAYPKAKYSKRNPND